jgi:hypothetical protein
MPQRRFFIRMAAQRFFWRSFICSLPQRLSLLGTRVAETFAHPLQGHEHLHSPLLRQLYGSSRQRVRYRANRQARAIADPISWCRSRHHIASLRARSEIFPRPFRCPQHKHAPEQGLPSCEIQEMRLAGREWVPASLPFPSFCPTNIKQGPRKPNHTLGRAIPPQSADGLGKRLRCRLSVSLRKDHGFAIPLTKFPASSPFRNRPVL